MSSKGTFSLLGYSDEQLYDHLKNVWNRARERFGFDKDPSRAFQEDDRRINLLAARGFLVNSLQPIENRNTVWDDTLFVIYREGGARKVAKFKISTEHGDSNLIFDTWKGKANKLSDDVIAVAAAAKTGCGAAKAAATAAKAGAAAAKAAAQEAHKLFGGTVAVIEGKKTEAKAQAEKAADELKRAEEAKDDTDKKFKNIPSREWEKVTKVAKPVADLALPAADKAKAAADKAKVAAGAAKAAADAAKAAADITDKDAAEKAMAEADEAMAKADAAVDEADAAVDEADAAKAAVTDSNIDIHEGLSLMVPGMYPYAKGKHGGYDALKPELKLSDKSQVVKPFDLGPASDDLDTTGPTSPGEGLNIHKGGDNEEGPRNWSEGCQVVFFGDATESLWKTFIDDLVGKDPSIRKHDGGPQTGLRNVIYTLVEGEFLRPTSPEFPFANATAEELYRLYESGPGGYYPVGTNSDWHGGIHLEKPKSEPVRAIADGVLVAYRLNKETLKTSIKIGSKSVEKPYSSGFALIKHHFKTPENKEIPPKANIIFYSLYMHLLPFDGYTRHEPGPCYLVKMKFEVKSAPSGNGLNIHKEPNFNKGNSIAVVPTGMIFKVTKGAPSKKSSFVEGNYDGMAGFICLTNATARALVGPTGPAHFGEPGEYQCLSTTDPALDPGKKGLNIYKDNRKDSIVERLALKGSELKFKDLGRFPVFDGVVWKNPGFQQLEDDQWVYLEKDYIECKVHVEPPDKYDQVVQCSIPIAVDSIVGYPGPYIEQPAMVHFEVIPGDVEFMKNQNKDSGASEAGKIPPGKIFKMREKVKPPEQKLVVPKGSSVELEDKGVSHTKIKCVAFSGWVDQSNVQHKEREDASGKTVSDFFAGAAGITAFFRAADSAAADVPVSIAAGKAIVYKDYNKANKRYQVAYSIPDAEQSKFTGWTNNLNLEPGAGKKAKLALPLELLYTRNPEVDVFEFPSDAGKNTSEMIFDFPKDPACVCQDADGKCWYEVKFDDEKGESKRGWIKEGEFTRLSAYDWPRWDSKRETESMKTDGICDIKEVIEMIDTDADKKLQQGEIQKQIQHDKIRKVAFYFPTEWMAPGTKYDRLLEKPWALKKDTEYKWLTELIENCKWWENVSDEVKKELSPDGTGAMWHVHPIAFIENLRKLVLEEV